MITNGINIIIDLFLLVSSTRKNIILVVIMFVTLQMIIDILSILVAIVPTYKLLGFAILVIFCIFVFIY